MILLYLPILVAHDAAIKHRRLAALGMKVVDSHRVHLTGKRKK
jgi:hypothetical protein